MTDNELTQPTAFPELIRGLGEKIAPDYSGPSLRGMASGTLTSIADLLERSGGAVPPGQPSMGQILSDPSSGNLSSLFPATSIIPAGGLLSSAALREGSEAGMFSAYHGTPHKFDEFKDEAIGSGEGAQVYGYGHYVAGNPKVAAEYRSRLAGDVAEYMEPMTPQQESGMSILNNSMMGSRGEKDPQQWLSQLIANYKSTVANTPSRYWADPGLAQSIKDLESLDVSKIQHHGSLYSVAIKPDEKDLLSWDEPISDEHSAKLESLLGEDTKPGDIWKGAQKYDPDLFHMEDKEQGWKDVTGEDVYKFLATRLAKPGQLYNDKAASEALNSVGIPGIKYFDQFSRRKAEGTRNYVIFDPKNLKITGRNGQQFEPIDHDPFK